MAFCCSFMDVKLNYIDFYFFQCVHFYLLLKVLLKRRQKHEKDVIYFKTKKGRERESERIFLKPSGACHMESAAGQKCRNDETGRLTCETRYITSNRIVQLFYGKNFTRYAVFLTFNGVKD